MRLGIAISVLFHGLIMLIGYLGFPYFRPSPIIQDEVVWVQIENISVTLYLLHSFGSAPKTTEPTR